ncbi:MAG TPA: hypothetical protein VHL78_03375 [Actinomycetota bacterium]|nr:hypothetical protein [Actinomycetota bacterium]
MSAQEARIAKIAGKVQPFLEPGETVRDAVYGAAGGRTAIFLGLLAYGMKLAYPSLVVLTDRHLYVFKGSMWSTTTPKAVVAKTPVGAAEASMSAGALTVTGEPKPIWLGVLAGRGSRLAQSLAAMKGR